MGEKLSKFKFFRLKFYQYGLESIAFNIYYAFGSSQFCNFEMRHRASRFCNIVQKVGTKVNQRIFIDSSGLKVVVTRVQPVVYTDLLHNAQERKYNVLLIFWVNFWWVLRVINNSVRLSTTLLLIKPTLKRHVQLVSTAPKQISKPPVLANFGRF